MKKMFNISENTVEKLIKHCKNNSVNQSQVVELSLGLYLATAEMAKNYTRALKDNMALDAQNGVDIKHPGKD